MLQLLIKVNNYEFCQIKVILTQKQKRVAIFIPFPLYDGESIVFKSSFRNGDFDGFTRYGVFRIRKSHV